MSLRGKESKRENRNDMLPNFSATPLRSEAIMVAGELSRSADAIKWTRPLELADLEKIADQSIKVGY